MQSVQSIVRTGATRPRILGRITNLDTKLIRIYDNVLEFKAKANDSFGAYGYKGKIPYSRQWGGKLWVQQIELPIKDNTDRTIPVKEMKKIIKVPGLKVYCSCPSFKYEYRHMCLKNKCLRLQSEMYDPEKITKAPVIRNFMEEGMICKHLLFLLGYINKRPDRIARAISYYRQAISSV